jgi:ribonuclease P protein component
MAALRSYRLPSQPAYRQVAVQGKFVRTPSLSMRWIESPDGFCRFCFLAKKRNKCRRVLRPLFFGMVPSIQKPVWAMVIVTDNSEVMTAERLRESAFKIFRKMEWRTDAAGAPDVEG